jgi:hypothetical protein
VAKSIKGTIKTKGEKGGAGATHIFTSYAQDLYYQLITKNLYI